MSYTEFLFNIIIKEHIGMPIYSNDLARKLADAFHLSIKDANAATATAMKRIINKGFIGNLRSYQKGIFYLTRITPFGETPILKEQLIKDKYLCDNKGYESGLSLLNKMGLTTQMPKKRTIVTNMANNGTRSDEKLDVVITPPKTEITESNKKYLQMLDALEMFEKAPIDGKNPYETLHKYVDENRLDYVKLFSLADKYYSKKTIINLAHIVNCGEILV